MATTVRLGKRLILPWNFVSGTVTSLSWPWTIMINRASLAIPFRLLSASAIMICMLTEPSLVGSSLSWTERTLKIQIPMAGHAAMFGCLPAVRPNGRKHCSQACLQGQCLQTSPRVANIMHSVQMQRSQGKKPGSYRSF